MATALLGYSELQIDVPALRTDVRGGPPRGALKEFEHGIKLSEQELYQEALAAFEAALRHQPDFPEAHNNRGNVLRRLQRYEEALAAYEKAIALRPEFAEAHHNEGIIFAHLGDPENALAAFRRALTLRPDLPQPRFGGALVLLAQEDLETADAEMEHLWLQHTVPEMHRTYARLLEKTARQLQRQGNKEEARLYREKARRAWARSAKGMWTKEQAEAVRDEVRATREAWQTRVVALDSEGKVRRLRALEASKRLDERRKQTGPIGMSVSELIEEGRPR